MVLEDGLPTRIEHGLIRNVRIRESDLDRMLLVLDGQNGHGNVVVAKDYVAVLVQRRTERESTFLRQIVQLDVLPQDSEGGAWL